MEGAGQGIGQFQWPVNPDIVDVGIEKIITKMEPPRALSKRYIGWPTDQVEYIDDILAAQYA